MDKRVSLLDVSESTAMKGLLIILIVIGHNVFFTSITEPIQMMGYLYCFHVQSFFIIPFLYGSKPFSKKRCGNYFMRLYWPYIIVTTLLYLGYYVIYEKNTFEIMVLPKLWFWGQSSMLKQYCGIQILWFMPAMFSLSILKDLYYSYKPIVKFVLLLLSSIFLIISLLSQDWGDYYLRFSRLLPYGLPLAMNAAFPFLIWGVVCRMIIEFTSSKKVNLWLLWALWIILSILYFFNIIMWDRNILVLSSLMAIFPILFIIILFRLRSLLSQSKLMTSLGGGSFQIYIIHPFIGYILMFLIINYEIYALQYKIGIILGSTLLMLIGGYLFYLIVNRNSIMKRFIFPRSINHFFKGSDKRL